ncbi:unnamed protein product, partial [Notodromas monacha]
MSRQLEVVVVVVAALWLLASAASMATAAKAPKEPHKNPTLFYLGCVLSNNKYVHHFSNIIERFNFNDTSGGLTGFKHAGVTLYNATMLMNPNPILTALQICNELISKQVYAIVVSHPVIGELSPAAVSYTAGFYHIPVIGISSRDSAFSDKNIHVSFLRTVPPYSHQADVWVELLQRLAYSQVVIIQSSDTDGRAILGRFQSVAHNLEDETDIEAVIEYEAGHPNFEDHLKEAGSAQSRVILLYASKSDSENIFKTAETLGMTKEPYCWIVTEQALEADNVPVGALGLKLFNSTNEEAHIHDSLYVMVSGLKEMYEREDIHPAPTDCNNTGEAWKTGDTFFRYIQKQELVHGYTGKVAFDENGDRKNAEYDVINVQDKGAKVSVGKYSFSQAHCCRGYCMDLLTELSKRINFTFELALGTDGSFGAFEYMNKTGKKEWTGLIGELVSERADMIVAPLTINPERAQVIDFSKPFKYQGITILEKKQPQAPSLVSFLQPFENALWILVMVSVHVVALVLYLLDRFSPFGRFRETDKPGTQEDALNLSSAIWFAWGVLLNSGIGEGTPRSFSGRVLGMVWAGFAMIIVASYTANLAAFLVLDRPKSSLSGINDARVTSLLICCPDVTLLSLGSVDLNFVKMDETNFPGGIPMLRNPMENFTYATVRASAVDMYFRRQVELSNMYRTMEEKNFANAEDAIAAVKAGDLNAFIWDSSRLEYEAAKDCDLVTAGELFGRSGYGIGLQKGSPWTDRVTLAILDFHERE